MSNTNFSEFIRNASEKEKQETYQAVMDKAIQDQKDIMNTQETIEEKCKHISDGMKYACSDCISLALQKQREEIVKMLEHLKVVNYGKPDTELTSAHYEWGYRVGQNHAIEKAIKDM